MKPARAGRLQDISRRQFLGALAGAAVLAGCSRSPTRAIPGELVGATAARGHRLRKADFPAAEQTEQHEIVIAGGGISGLAAARQLARNGRNDFVLLELEDHAGGNSSHGRNAVSAYPWGAHYVSLPSSEATEVTELYEELGLIVGRDSVGRPIYDEFALVTDPAERLFLHGRWQEGLIPKIGATDADLAEFAAFGTRVAELKSARGRDGRRAFAIPVDRSSRDEQFTALDGLTMSAWVEQQGWKSAQLRWHIDYACRDDFGGGIEQVSAWAGLHYFASRDGVAANAESDALLTWPEGNGWLAERLRAPVERNIRTGLVAWNIAPATTGGVVVDAYDFTRSASRRFLAQAALVCVPRHVAQRITAPLRVLPPAPVEYGTWAVANLTLDRRLTGAGFAPAWDNVFYDSRSLGYVTATHQRIERENGPTVITWYEALCDGSTAAIRQQAFERSHADWCALILADLRRVHPEIDDLVRRIDVCVWGHGMVRPVPGSIWTEARLRRAEPIGAIHFAHSDLSGISIFEEAYTRGVLAAHAITAQLHPA